MSAAERLPETYSEAEAARLFKIELEHIATPYMRKKLGAVRIRRGTYIYTDEIINQAILRCQGKQANSAAIGSASVKDPQSGIEPGTTQLLDRHAAHLSAQSLKRKRS